MHELHYSIQGHRKAELFPEDDLKQDASVENKIKMLLLRRKHIDGVSLSEVSGILELGNVLGFFS